MTVNITLVTLRVLRVFLDAPEHELYGLEISDGAKLQNGTISPILDRLLAAGWLTSRYESPGAFRGRRRYWRLTELGIEQSRIAMNDARKLLRLD